MRIRALVLTLALAMAGGALMAATPARAADWWNYREYHYYRGHDPSEVRRREIVRERLFDLGDRVRLANRSDRFSRHEERRMRDKLDDVRDFLRHDHYLDRDEFRRRMHDLDDVEDILFKHGGRGSHRYEYNDRYYHHYDEDYYLRRDR